jgi:DNA polymerase III subunit beta
MKFIVSSSPLLKQLQLISGVISANTVLPILEDFLFSIEDKKLSIVATDLETVMSVQIDVESKTDGKVCIPAKILLDTLKNLPEQPLTFNIDKSFGIEITGDSGRYKMSGEDADNFPKEPVNDTSTSFQMVAKGLVTAINKTLFAVSNDDLRPAMTGVFFELFEDGVQFVATDAHRLVRYKRTDAKATEETSFIVPKKPLNLLRNALPANNDTIKVSYNANHLFVEHEGVKMICRLIEARFPDYRVVIPAENPYKLVVDKADFQAALRRVSIFSNKSTNQVALSITSTQLTMVSQDSDYNNEGNERLACQYDGEDMQIAFNAKFLIEMLQAADTNEVKVELSTSTKAGLVKPIVQADDEDLLMLVMPLMLNN